MRMSSPDDFAAPPTRPSSRRIDHALTPATVLAGRYRIVRSLAEGGMGEVYEAEDLELREHIALKTILPELADDRRHIERFKREVQLARRITHPSVCRLFELGHDTVDGNELWFLTMELLDGETLAQRLKRGKLTTAQALPIVRQVCAGLTATHATGIVHRDLKPGNIVLCTSGRVVLTDFGIASGHQTVDRFKESVTLSGEFIGSPEYMAPEQVEGEELTPRADIYALGAVMYEMVTGELPFEGTTDFATAAKRLTQSPTSPRTKVPDLDPRWEAVILRCMERDPAKRFNGVDEVAAALRGGRIKQPITGKLVAAGAAVVAIAAGGLAVGYVLRGHERQTTNAPVVSGTRPAVAVVVEDREPATAAAAAALETELAAGERLRVISGDRVAQVVAESGDIAGMLGAQLVVHVKADAHAITAHVVRADEAFDLTAADATALAVALRERLGIAALTAAERHAAHAALVEPAEAAQHYALGLAALRRDDSQAARGEFAKAAALAPNAPLVHAALARAWDSLGYERQARDEADRAFALAGELARTDKLQIEALRAGTQGNWVRAAELYGALWEFFPDDLEWGLDLADAQSHAGRNKELEGTLAAMRRVPPPQSDDPRIDLAEADMAENLGDFKREREVCEHAVAKSQAPGRHALLARARSFEGWAELQLGNADQAIADYEVTLATSRELGDQIDAAGSMVNIANVRRRQGKPDEAMKLYQDALAIYDQFGAKSRMWVALNGSAIVLADRGDLEGAQHAFEHARDVTRDTGDRVGEATADVNIGLVAFERGALDDAKTAEEAAVAIARELGDKRMIGMAQHALGGIFEELGDTSEARRRYELALAAREDAGDAAGQATTRASLAGLLVDDGKLDEAIASAQLAAQDLEKQELPDEAAAAYTTLADAQLAAGHKDLAAQAADKAETLAKQGEDKPTQLGVELVKARLAADPKAADSVATRAKQLGFTGVAFEARIAAAQLRKSKKQLAEVATEAKAAGFAGLARRGK